MTDKPRAPQAFRIDSENETRTARALKPHVKIEFQEAEEPQLPAEAPMAEANARRRGFRWGSLLLTCLLALGSLGFSLSVTHLIEQLFQWSLTLGWFSVALAGLAGFAFVMIIGREIWGLMRLRRIEHLQVLTARAMNQSDEVASKEALHGLKNSLCSAARSCLGHQVMV